MLGQGVLRDGRSLHEAYGCDLDKLVEGDRVGVMRTSQVNSSINLLWFYYIMVIFYPGFVLSWIFPHK